MYVKGIDFNANDVFGNTAFHHACKVGSVEVVEIFLNSPRIDYNSLNNAEESGIISSFYNECTSFITAFHNGHHHIVNYLLHNSKDKKIDVNMTNDR